MTQKIHETIKCCRKSCPDLFIQKRRRKMMVDKKKKDMAKKRKILNEQNEGSPDADDGWEIADGN